MASSSDTDQRIKATRLLGKNMGKLEDKEAAWRDLHMLTGDLDSGVREWAARALEKAFSQVTNRDAAWKDLVVLAGDQDSDVQWSASFALEAAFQYVLDKNAAWKDLTNVDKCKGQRHARGYRLCSGCSIPVCYR